MAAELEAASFLGEEDTSWPRKQLRKNIRS
jgi:hypothetical protein